MIREDLIKELLESADGTIPHEYNLSNEIQADGILIALRVILRCPEGQSLLRHAANVRRRADQANLDHPALVQF